LPLLKNGLKRQSSWVKNFKSKSIKTKFIHTKKILPTINFQAQKRVHSDVKKDGLLLQQGLRGILILTLLSVLAQIGALVPIVQEEDLVVEADRVVKREKI
jgi:hypothetical protein